MLFFNSISADLLHFRSLLNTGCLHEIKIYYSANRNCNKTSVRLRNKRRIGVSACSIITQRETYFTEPMNIKYYPKCEQRQALSLSLSFCPCREHSATLWRATALKLYSVGYRCITWIRGAVTWTKPRPLGQVTWLHHDLWDWHTHPHCPLL